MRCSAISNSTPCQSENLALNIGPHKSLKYGLIYGRDMVSVQGIFEQTKAIQAQEKQNKTQKREKKTQR